MNNTSANARIAPAPAAKTNRLIGWLVSYAMDQKGKAFEIRTGRTFIGASRLPDERLIQLNEGSISNAHVALLASAKHKVVIQDIFSDAGSFITKAGADKEQPINGPVEIGHGDWVRLGNKTRFQVCLIDGPNR